ncbi:MAG: sulfatase-like hydrolase/transferase [Planctomycetota bacterium]
MARMPHLVLFNPDQWRGDAVGHMGDPAAQTPVLDRFAATEAVSFRNAFCQNPVCTPSRCSFMTGWYPHVRGHRTMFHMLHEDEPNLLRRLKEAGYCVWWGGKNDLVPGQGSFEPHCSVKYQPARRPATMWLEDHKAEWRGAPGSDTYYSFYVGKLPHTAGDEFYYDSDWANVLGAVEQIRNYDGKQPLCIYLPLTYPHPPYAVEEPWYSRIDRAKLPARIPTPADWSRFPAMLGGIAARQGLQGWSEARWTELRATYYGMCARVDHQFGLVLDALREKGLYDDTGVFFFSDHGDFTGDYGLVEKNQNTFQDDITRVPFLVKPPKGHAVKPRVSDALVELIDMPATVEALTGIPTTHTHYGRSLLPLVAGETDTHRDAVFCEGGRRRGEIHCMEKESTSNQNPEGLYWPRVDLQAREEPLYNGHAVMCRTDRFKFVRRLYEADELYDLRADPGELRNLIDDPAHRETAAKLRERLLTFFMETSDAVPHQADRR